MLALASAAWAAGPWLSQHGIRLDAVWPLGIAGVLALANAGYLAMLRVTRNSPNLAAAAHRGLWLQILVDLAVLTVVVHFLGSVHSVAPLMYLFHIVLVCIFFSSAESLAVTGIALAMYVSCVTVESFGAFPAQSMWHPAPPAAEGLASAAPWVLAAHVGSVAFISVTIWFLASRLAGALRQRDADLGGNQSAADGRHRRAGPAHAANHASAQGPLRRHPRQHASAPGRVLRQDPRRGPASDRQDFRPLRHALPRRSRPCCNWPTSAPAPRIRPSRRRSNCTRSSASAWPRWSRWRQSGESLSSEDIAPATIRGVHDHVVMMLDNVLSNAVAYSCDGQKVSVSCQAEAVGRSGRQRGGFGHRHPHGQAAADLRRLLPHRRGGETQQGLDRPGPGHRPPGGHGGQGGRARGKRPATRHAIYPRFSGLLGRSPAGQLDTRRLDHGLRIDRRRRH